MLRAGWPSFKLLAEGSELLLNLGEVLAQAGYFFFERDQTLGYGVCGGIRGRGSPRHIGLRRFAGEEVGVAGFFSAGLAREDPGQGRLALGEAVERGDDVVESFETVHAVGAAAEFAGSLR